MKGFLCHVFLWTFIKAHHLEWWWLHWLLLLLYDMCASPMCFSSIIHKELWLYLHNLVSTFTVCVAWGEEEVVPLRERKDIVLQVPILERAILEI